ncbi:DNA-binding protein RFX7 isoform X2 [Pangasianodon hypophthalmus]|uniref:DNA-binding protein RFX7 isoform X2 n=1 Tax=Pangasianodon hypophthalmus TaxID=310915 RepID=UPI0023077E72|nr:DNA-binding protein RFX7 isoform X2 [Pangasianodon hypophthalmus]
MPVMADEQQPQGQQPQPGSLLPTALQGAESSALQLKIKNSICKSVQSKVDSILQDVERFTDIEKLYLYLRLPSGPSSSGSDKIEQSCVSSSRMQQMHAFSWIRNHLEEHADTSLPKQEVFDEYKSYCDNLGYHALSAADFGKIMKNVFPNMKARRLGMRGKSKYCYSGLRKKPFIHMPSLPNLDVHKTGDGCEGFEPTGQNSSGEDEIRSAACDLVCEWAQKVLSRQFVSVEDLARFLLNSHYISTKSVAALTVMTGSPSGAPMSVQSSAFMPTTDAHSFQPQVKTLTSPSIDAKQQLQRKIQKKQQEQKLHSPLPPEAQGRRAEGVTTPCASTGIPCGSPALLSPQPTIGIVVATVPSPVTVQRSRQLMSPSPVPVATAESKVLPVNFQVVTQSVQPVNRCPKTPQNVPASPVGDRPARHRYAQILPKPATTSAITLRSPPALLITKSSIKTVIPSPKDSSVNIVKMTAISLGPSTSTTSTAATTARPASAGITSRGDDLQPVTRVRSGSIAAMPTLSMPGQTTTTPAVNINLDVADAVARAREAQGGTTGGGVQVEGALKPRAASVPTPLAKISAELDRQSGNKFNGLMLPDGGNLAAGSNNNPIESTLYQDIANQSSSSAPTTSNSAFMTPPKDAELASPCPRKRQGLHPDSSLTPVKKIYISEGNEDAKLAMKIAMKSVSRSDIPVEPESELSSAAGKVMVKLSSSAPTRILAFSDSPVGNTGFQAVSSSQSILQGQWEVSSSNVKNITTGTTAVSAPCQDCQVRNTSFQTFNRPQSVSQGQWEGSLSNMNSKPIVTRTVSAPGQALLQQHANKNTQFMQVGSDQSSSSAVCELNAVLRNNEQQDANQQQIYSQQGTVINKQMSSSVMEPPVMTRPTATGQLVQMTTDMVEHVSSQPHVGYFPFNDDDMTQDSIVEELVQMEEQMKMNSSMQSFDGCEDMALQSQQAALQNNMISSHQASTSCYNLANTSSTPIHTPTQGAEMIGMGQGLTRESPCSHFAPTTPVDSALGSSCQTPIGTPHSNCSSGVPPSPVECRNPFAFTPINSSITSYHDGSTISSSPVKPMQRPMATHPDKAKLDWMNNNYNSSSSNSNSGISILPNYQNLVDNQFRKPHAFAIPGQTYPSPVRHHDMHISRLTPISPVQQQVASMVNLNKQEGFAVPAPLDNKTSTSSSGSFRCRSVSPAVRQRNLSGTPNPNVRRYVVSPFNSQVTPEVLNIFANTQANTSVSSMVQRSQSVPLNVMMQTEVLPMQAGGQTSNTKNITSVLLNKMDGDGDNVVRGLGMNNMPSSYTARMNLSQILETTAASGFPAGANHQAMISPGSSAYKFTKPAYLMKNNGGEQISFSAREAQGQLVSEEKKQLSEEQQNQALMVPPQQDLQQHQHQQSFLFNTTDKDLLDEDNLNTVSQLPGQATELGAGVSEFPGDMQLTSELSSSMNDLNSLDANLLFDPASSQQQVQYEEPTLEELKNDPIFQQICSETVNSAGFDWLESKDQATVEMLG